jgi:predicted metal-dependent peptidase
MATAKPKLADFKRFLAEMTEEELRAEMLKLFSKLDQVQGFYAQELMSESGRKAMLDEYKKKIYSQYWTRTGNPRSVSNAEVRKIIGEFEKVSVFPTEMIDLLLYRVETMTDWASQFGGAPDADYNASSTSFEKALKLMEKNKLEAYFKDRCNSLFLTDNLDYWYIEDLESLYETYFPE